MKNVEITRKINFIIKLINISINVVHATLRLNKLNPWLLLNNLWLFINHSFAHTFDLRSDAAKQHSLYKIIHYPRSSYSSHFILFYSHTPLYQKKEESGLDTIFLLFLHEIRSIFQRASTLYLHRI